MSVKLRLVVIIGLAFTLLWAATAAWLWRDVTQDLQRMLDNRLAMSTHMVAGLLDRNLPLERDTPRMSPADALVTVPGGQNMACQIRSMRGEVIAATQTAPQNLSTGLSPGYHTQVINDTAWRTFTVRAGNRIITTADRVAGRNLLRRRIALTVGIPFVVAIIGGLLALWFGVSRGLGPLRRLRRELASRGPDALDPLETTRLPGELKPLVATLNHLLHRTDQAMQRERHFTNDAAHELRTPLTAISTHLQVARMTRDEATATSLADAQTGVARMQATVEQLLLLARVEGHLPFAEGSVIDANTALARAVADSGPEADERVIRNENAIHTHLAAPSALVVTALRNLIDNALHYSPTNSPVTVEIELRRQTVLFRVLDRGPGLQDDAVTRATQRFWRSSKHHGSGLGLTIVDAIVRRYGGQLSLTNLGTGLEACLELPRSG